jgi:hypothetical protein
LAMKLCWRCIYSLALQVVDFELGEVCSISVPVAERGVARAVMISLTAVTALCLVATSVCENGPSTPYYIRGSAAGYWMRTGGRSEYYACCSSLVSLAAGLGKTPTHRSQTSFLACAAVRCSPSCWGIWRCQSAAGQLVRVRACRWSSLSAEVLHQFQQNCLANKSWRSWTYHSQGSCKRSLRRAGPAHQNSNALSYPAQPGTPDTHVQSSS